MARHSIPDIIERATPRETRGSVPARVRPLAVNLFLSLRPAQWTKNLIIFGPLLLGQRLRDGGYVGTLLDGSAVVASIAAFVIFCALSGVVYLLNDVADREADARHPIKRYRPIASGAVPVSAALTTAAILGTAALGAAFWLRPAFGLLGAGYVGLLVLYSGPLKHVVIIDVLTIAIGFVLRAAAGAVAIDVVISHWLLILTILLALFLALSKRRHELVLLADEATSHRPILQEYSPYLLDQMIVGGDGLDAPRVRVLYREPRDDSEVRIRPPRVDAAVSALRHLPVPLSRAPERGGWQPGRDAGDRPAAARVCRAVGDGPGTDHLLVADPDPPRIDRLLKHRTIDC